MITFTKPPKTPISPLLLLPITEKLKTETHAHHTQLESHALLRSLMTDQLTVDGYATILRLFYGFFAPLEQQLAAFPELQQFLPDLRERRKSATLLTDLYKLNGSSAIGAPPVFAQPAALENLADCFGCLYVLEGSTLGGKFIVQQVSKTLGTKVTHSLGFFGGYGSQTGQYWKTFREALTHFSNHTGSDAVIIRSAQTTFQQFYHWLTLNENQYRNAASV